MYNASTRGLLLLEELRRSDTYDMPRTLKAFIVAILACVSSCSSTLCTSRRGFVFVPLILGVVSIYPVGEVGYTAYSVVSHTRSAINSVAADVGEDRNPPKETRR